MPTLRDMLSKTMIFTAAAGGGASDFYGTMLAPGAPISPPVPHPTFTDDEDVIEENAVWQWTHDPANPGVVTNVGCKVRGMGMNYGMTMPVCDRIEWKDLWFDGPDGNQYELPIRPEYVIGKFFLQRGTVPDSSSGLFSLFAKTDASFMVVLAYQMKKRQIVPLTKAEIDQLGDKLMPEPSAAIEGQIGDTLTATMVPLRFLVCLSLVCCKERPDWEPGELLGAVRVYPHTMVVCNAALTEVQGKTIVTRPGQSMPHDAEMMSDIGALFVTDTNASHTSLPGPPLPLWDNLFDYYSLHPTSDLGDVEVTFVDRSKGARTITSGVQRNARKVHFGATTAQRIADFYEASSPFTKVPGQGEFDNIHLAPRMRIEWTTQAGVNRQANIAMAPFCVHDCLHTHMRWGTAGETSAPKSNKGFAGMTPYQSLGTPGVPANQSVKVKMLSESSFRYRAIASQPRKSEWQCFFHHGMGYAQDIWPTFTARAKAMAARKGVQEFANAMAEPWTNVQFGPLNAVWSWGQFYWRLRYGGVQDLHVPAVNAPLERLKILSLAECRK